MKQGLTYSDVLILPRYSEISTRKNIDITSNYLGKRRIPIISAPMDYVTGLNMAKSMANNGAYGIISRFGVSIFPVQSQYDWGKAIGLKDVDKSIENILIERPHSVCIDVAHGHHKDVKDVLQYVKEKVSKVYTPYFIAGNVATSGGFEYLALAGADAIRVGIGPGSACSTRENTGVGVPQLTAIMDCFDRRQYWPNVSLIADGGINTPGDIAKALAAGADAVMLGKMLAGHDESPGELITERRPGTNWNGTFTPGQIRQQYKKYRGQSLLGTNGERGAPEGVEGTVDYKGPVDKTIQSLVSYIQSSFSYVGANNLKEFRQRAEFIQVSPGTMEENKTRL